MGQEQKGGKSGVGVGREGIVQPECEKTLSRGTGTLATQAKRSTVLYFPAMFTDHCKSDGFGDFTLIVARSFHF